MKTKLSLIVLLVLALTRLLTTPIEVSPTSLLAHRNRGNRDMGLYTSLSFDSAVNNRDRQLSGKDPRSADGVGNTYAYIAFARKWAASPIKFQIVDVSNPQAPQFVGEYPFLLSSINNVKDIYSW